MIEKHELFSEAARELSRQIAEDVFETGSEVGYPVTRIAFKCRSNRTDNERELGGLCQSSLTQVIQTSIIKAMKRLISQT